MCWFLKVLSMLTIILLNFWLKSVNSESCLISRAIEYGVDSENLSLSAIRTIRVLRPLRAINRIPSKTVNDIYEW